jgi:uncharacterized protein YeaO (DUF488 family)
VSIEAVALVLNKSRATGRAKLVLLGIANHLGDQGAWPAISTLARYANASERSVKRDIQELIDLGELRVELQNAPTQNQYKTNLYWITIQSGVTDLASGVTAGGVQTLNRTITEPLTETERELFNEFWKEYPKKSDKRVAFKAFRSALKRAKFEELIAGVIAYRKQVLDVEPRYIKNPSTWLNADAWENEIAPSPDSEAAERARIRKQRDLEESARYLAELRSREQLAAPAPKCPHGRNVALCKECLQ